MQFKHFKYCKAYRIPYRGCYFHSLLELKFALYLERDYRYLREPVIIGYDPKTMTTSDYFRESTKLYTPDFLIRHKTSGKASLIEIKPDKLKCSPESNIYYRIATDYINRVGLDADFQIISEKDFYLTGDMLKRYEVFERHKAQYESISSFRDLDRKYNHQANRYFNNVPSFPNDALNKNEYARFVKRGNLALAA